MELFQKLLLALIVIYLIMKGIETYALSEVCKRLSNVLGGPVFGLR